MNRIKTYDATGVAPNGRLYAGDLNLLQDTVAALTDYAQNLAASSIAIGDASLAISKFGTGELQVSNMLRVLGIFRAASGFVSGSYTTTTRDALVLPPYGLVILNTTTNQYEWNSGTSAVPIWTSLGGGSLTVGADAAKGAASATNKNKLYFSTDVNGGTLYGSTGTAWQKLAPGLTESPTASVATTVAGLPGAPVDGQMAKMRIGQANDVITLIYDSTIAKWVSPQSILMETDYGALTGNNDILMEKRGFDIGALAAAGLAIETRWFGYVSMSDTSRGSTGGVYLDLDYSTNSYSINGQYSAVEGVGQPGNSLYGTIVNDARMSLGGGEANNHTRDTGWILFNPIAALAGLTSAARGWLRSHHVHDDTLSSDSVTGTWYWRFRTP